MKLLDWVKWIFPKPRLPQKRYLIIAFSIFYALAQIYVKSTPNKVDDEILEKAHELVFQMLADGRIIIDPVREADDEDKQAYGELA